MKGGGLTGEADEAAIIKMRTSKRVIACPPMSYASGPVRTAGRASG